MAPPELLIFYIEIQESKGGKAHSSVCLQRRLFGSSSCFDYFFVLGFFFFLSCGLFLGKFLKKKKAQRSHKALGKVRSRQRRRHTATAPRNTELLQTLPGAGWAGWDPDPGSAECWLRSNCDPQLQQLLPGRFYFNLFPPPFPSQGRFWIRVGSQGRGWEQAHGPVPTTDQPSVLPAWLWHWISQDLGLLKAEITASACVMQPTKLPLGILDKAGADCKSISSLAAWDGDSFGILLLATGL